MNPLLADLPPPPPGRRGWPWTEAPAPVPHTAPLPRVTIVTPSFNQAAYLEETIRSVLLQGYPNLEYIVFDGGSSDGSVDILKKYSPWIDHWTSERDNGQSDAIGKGLARATGDWFNWINSDDTLAPGGLAALVATASPDRAILSGRTANLRGDSVFSRYGAQVPSAWPAALFHTRVNQPGSLLRLSSVRSSGGIRGELRLVMDLDLWLRLLLRTGPAAHHAVETEVATYRYHEASKTCSAPDAFAGEEFAVLHDLALSLGAPSHPPLAALRARSSPRPLSFPSPSTPVAAAAAEAAWIDRLIVSDSLLFRAALAGVASPRAALAELVAALRQLRPVLARHHPGSDRVLAGRAIVHALQIAHVCPPSAALRALALAPGPRTLRALLRLLLPR